MLYDTASGSNKPSLNICPVSNVLGCVPLIPCFIDGNKYPMLPHSFGSRQGAVADTRPGAGNGSRLFEMSPWMWSYGRGQPRKVCVAEAEAGRQEWTLALRHQGAVTLKRRLEQSGADFYERQRSRQAGQAAADQE